MSYDNRMALPKGFQLNITDENTGNVYSLTIEREIGRGGSCITYIGTHSAHVGWASAVAQSVILKEFYPKALESMLKREDDMFLCVKEGAQEEFNQRLDLFCEGQAKHIIFASENAAKALPPVSFSGKALGTFYAVSNKGQGTTLSAADRNGITLTNALELSASICDAISLIHKNGMKLFLDCKPDNIYVFENHAYLFDFDTVQPIDRIRYCSYSKGWSAPEQESMSSTGYLDLRHIGFHTDIFSVGAVAYYILTGRMPQKNDLQYIQEEDAWQKDISLADKPGALNDKVFANELSRVMRSMLQPDAEKRKFNYADSDAAVKAKHEFEHLAELSENAPYRSGFKDTKETISAAKESVEETIKKNSLKHFLFGSSKRIFATISMLIAAAIILGTFASIGRRAADAILPMQASEISQEIDAHLLLKLSNANHQYEMGLENWRRLDYVRAERDILTSRNEIAREKSQSEIEVAKVNNSLGCLYLDMGRYADAYDYLNSAYITFRDQSGEKSVQTRAVRVSIAQYCYYIGKLDEALAETQYILDNSDEEKEKAILARTMHLRADIYDAQGLYDNALELYDDVLKLYGNISADGKLSEELADYANDPQLNQNERDYYINSLKWVIRTYANIARVNIHKEDPIAAIEAANTGIEMSLSNIYIGKRNLTTSKLYMNLAVAEGQKGDLPSALNDIDLAMRIQRNLFDFQDVYPGLVMIYDVYGNLLISKGNYSEARGYFENAVELANNSFGDNHPNTASAFNSLGNFLLLSGETKEAIEDLKHSIEIRKNILAENHPETVQMYFDLAAAQIEDNKFDDARNNLLRAKHICEELDIRGVLRDNIENSLSNSQLSN